MMRGMPRLRGRDPLASTMIWVSILSRKYLESKVHQFQWGALLVEHCCYSFPIRFLFLGVGTSLLSMLRFAVLIWSCCDLFFSFFFKKNSAISFIALKPMGKCALVSDSRRVVTVLHCTSNRASFVSIIVSVFVSYFTAYSAPTWFSTGFQHPLRNK